MGGSFAVRHKERRGVEQSHLPGALSGQASASRATGQKNPGTGRLRRAMSALGVHIVQPVPVGRLLGHAAVVGLDQAGYLVVQRVGEEDESDLPYWVPR